jgi:hypothetical protein
MSQPEHINQEILGRIRRAVEEKWPGNLKAAARDLGADYNLLIRVVKDGQAPPSWLLHAVSDVCDIDAGWLLTGRPSWPPRADGPRVPLLPQLLPVALGSYRPTRSITYASTTQEWAKAPTVYAYRVAAADPIVDVPDSQVRAGDILIIDTAPRVVMDISFAVQPPLVVWRWADRTGRVAKAALGFLNRDGDEYHARIFGQSSRRYPFEITMSEETENCPLLPSRGQPLTTDHLAGLVIGLHRVQPPNFLAGL